MLESKFAPALRGFLKAYDTRELLEQYGRAVNLELFPGGFYCLTAGGAIIGCVSPRNSGTSSILLTVKENIQTMWADLEEEIRFRNATREERPPNKMAELLNPHYWPKKYAI